MAHTARLLLLTLGCSGILACGGGGSAASDGGVGGGGAGGGAGGSGASPTYTVGGSVSGLNGTVVLQENGGSTVAVSADGSFTFATPLSAGAGYRISVLSQPTAQQCTVTGGTGTIATANVGNVGVACTSLPPHTVGGTISGLLSAIVLQNNGTDSLTVAANGAFSFGAQLAAGADYRVTVLSQPANQQCQVTAGAGVMAAADISNVVVTCSPPQRYTIGGTVSGLSGSVSLSDNGTDGIVVAANGTFTFPTPLASGATYSVATTGQPATQLCTVTSGSGTIAAANVTDVNVSCVGLTYTVGGVVSGLNGTLVLQNGGQDNLQITANGPFTFATPEVSGSTYLVSILTQPTSGQCAVRQAGGSVTNANVTGVEVLCNPLHHSRYVYVVNAGNMNMSGTSSLSQYTIGADGGLVPMVPASPAVGDQPDSIVVDPSGRYVYVTNFSTVGTIWQYTIGSDGSLTPVTPATVSAGGSPGPITVDRTGKYVYVGNMAPGGGGASSYSVSQFAIGAGGALVPLTPSTAAASAPPTGIAIAPSGSFAYASAGTVDTSGGVILQYEVNGDGTLVPANPAEISVDNAPVQALTLDPFGRYAYLLEPLAGFVREYAIDVGGGLTPLGFVLSTTSVPGSLAIDPYGKYVYAGSAGSISQYTIGVDGTLSAMAPAAVFAPSPALFRGVAVDLAGQYVYVTAEVYPGGGVYQYKIGSDGTLQPLATPSVAAGYMPTAIAISP